MSVPDTGTGAADGDLESSWALNVANAKTSVAIGNPIVGNTKVRLIVSPDRGPDQGKPTWCRMALLDKISAGSVRYVPGGYHAHA